MKVNAVWLGVLVAVASAAGCTYGTAYTYERGGGPAGVQTGPPVSSYSIPQKDPRGSVHVISLGAERLPVPAGQPDSFVHIRIAAENRGDDALWKVNPNEQALTHPGGSVPASYAEASTGGPVLALKKGQQGYLDVYYPSPPAEGPNRITLAWHLRRGEEVVPGSTDFDRVPSPQPGYASYYQPASGPNVYVGLGLSSWWWPDYYFWNQGPYWSPYPRFYGGYYGAGWGLGWGWGGAGYWPYGYGYGGRGYYGGGYYGGRGYYGGGGYYGGRGGYYGPSNSNFGGGGGGGWRGGGGGGAAPAIPYGGGGGGSAAPSGGGKSGWRGGGR